jgi:tetratricopeptide (TPR) repeat protein
MYNMKRLFIPLFLLNFTFLILSQDVAVKNIFINSTPIRAKVIIDGVDKGILTPCILRNITTLQKIISVYKPGYKERIIYLKDIKEKKLNINLMPLSFDLYFPENNIYKINDVSIQGPFSFSIKKSGTYKIDMTNEKIILKQASPFLPAEISLGTSLGISLTMTATTIAMSEYYSYESKSTQIEYDKRHYEDVSQGFNIGKYAAISITSALAVALAAVIISDATIRYKEKKAAFEIKNTPPADTGRALYDTSLQLLKAGDIDKSTKILQSFITLYPDSDYIPIIYYQVGQNFFIMKNHDEALKNWNIFISEYPLGDYFDYVIKNIAEIYYLKKDYYKALEILDRASFTEDIVKREDIFSFKAKMEFEIYKAEQKADYYKLAETDYLTLIDNSASLENLDLYYLYLIELYKLSNNSDKINKLKAKAESIQDSKIRELIKSYFK